MNSVSLCVLCVGNIVVPLNDGDPDSVSYTVTLYQYNPTNQEYVPVFQESELLPSSFPYVLEDYGMGQYVTVVVSSRANGDRRTVATEFVNGGIRGMGTLWEETV